MGWPAPLNFRHLPTPEQIQHRSHGLYNFSQANNKSPLMLLRLLFLSFIPPSSQVFESFRLLAILSTPTQLSQLNYRITAMSRNGDFSPYTGGATNSNSPVSGRPTTPKPRTPSPRRPPQGTGNPAPGPAGMPFKKFVQQCAPIPKK